MDNLKEEFQKDIIDLFSGKRGGHAQRWRYVLAPEMWHSHLIQNDKYYVRDSGIYIVNKTIKSLSKKGQLSVYKTVGDLGPGDSVAVKNKILPLIMHCPNVQLYASVDLSKDQLKAANDLVSSETGIETQAFHKNFFQESFAISKQKTICGFFGSTISNVELSEAATLPENKIIKNLKNIHQIVGSGNKILIEFDANRDLENAISAYDHHTWRRMSTAILHGVENILKPKGNFNPIFWKHVFIKNEKAHTIHQCIESIRPQHFSIAEHEFRISAFQPFVISNNVKYPVDVLADLEEKAGAVINDIYQDKTQRMTVMDVTPF